VTFVDQRLVASFNVMTDLDATDTAGSADFSEFMRRRQAVVKSYVAGDAAPLAAISTGSEPGTFFPPRGGDVQGAATVLATKEQGADRRGHGRTADTAERLHYADMVAVITPTLVIIGDDDAVELDHTVSLDRALPAARLAIVPAASHMLAREQPIHRARLVLDFLIREPPPQTMTPSRPLAQRSATAPLRAAEQQANR
jgi:pimeloyl-ACP methyl ester carboxylesterase